jgi:hypothetical protein
MSGIRLQSKAAKQHAMPQQVHNPAGPQPPHDFVASKPRWSVVPLICCCLIVLTVYIWLISVGTWNRWPTHWYAYDSLAASFRHGQLSLETRPDPALLALPNPYDPAARQAIPYPQDVSLYDGRFYFYFGPVPALFLVIAKSFVPSPIGDQYLVFAFVSGIFLLQSFLIVVIRNHFFPDTPPWTLLPVVAVAGLTNPLVWVVSTPSVYNAAISAGQFFFLAGFFAAFSAFSQTRASAWKLAIAGLLWIGALGSRITLALPIAFMTMFIVIGIALNCYRAGCLSKSIRPVLALGSVLGVGLAALGWYNWARFGSVFETGIKYQLAGVPLQEYGGKISSPSYIIQNLYNYFLNPPDLKYAFPYFHPVAGITRLVTSSIALPAIYRTQEMTGVIYSAPFLLLAVLPLISILLKNPGSLIRNDKGPWFTWLIVALAGSFLFGFAFFVTFFWAAERYLLDFLPCLLLLSLIGFWQLDRTVATRPVGRTLSRVILVSLMVASIVVSIMLSMTFNSDGFRQLNPVLWRQLSNLFRP